MWHKLCKWLFHEFGANVTMISLKRIALPMLPLILAASLACSWLTPWLGATATPSQTATLVRRPTNTATSTATRTLPPSPTFTPSDTPAPSLTWTFTPTPSFTPRPTRTKTPTRTAIPPTFTPAPDQITKGYDVWQLVALELRSQASFLGTPITPQQYNASPGGYRFLVMEFECLTGPSLITLFDMKEYGLVFVHRKDGYPQLWLKDERQRTFHLNMIATCWLAAVVPPDVQSATLFYNGFIFEPTIPLVEGSR